MAHHLHTLKGRPRLLELLLTGVRTSQGMGKFSDSAVKSGVWLLWISGWGICRRQGPIRPPPSEPVQAVPGTPTPPSEVFLTTTPHRSAYKSATHPAQVVALQCVAMLPFLLPLVKALHLNCAPFLRYHSCWCTGARLWTAAHPAQELGFNNVSSKPLSCSYHTFS